MILFSETKATIAVPILGGGISIGTVAHELLKNHWLENLLEEISVLNFEQIQEKDLKLQPLKTNPKRK